jgi:UDP-N-acetylglucosamine 4-epimerase
MNNRYQEVCEQLARKPARWLVTGAAGFIGSNLLQKLLSLDQEVVGLDNLSTGFTKNLDQVRGLVTPAQWARFRFVNGDIQNLQTCREACRSVDYLLHQAALGSVPRSIEDPVTSNASNVDGFVSICWAAHLEKVKSAVYASSSAVYGDHPALPKREEAIGESLSPLRRHQADERDLCRGLLPLLWDEAHRTALLQRLWSSPGSRWRLRGGHPQMDRLDDSQPTHPDQWGWRETSRDFCYIANVVQANILAATDPGLPAGHRVFNVALDQRLTLNQLFQLLRERLMNDHPHLKKVAPLYAEFRAGDVRHSQADISLIRKVLGYEPTYNVSAGLDEALSWYQANLKG